MSLSVSASSAVSSISVSAVPVTLSAFKPFGGLLDDLSTRINAIISGALQNAGEQVNRLLIQAANQVNATIQNTLNTFQADLEKDFVLLDKSVQDIYNQLNTLVAKIETDGARALSEIEQTAINIMGMLPFADKQTRFTSISPRYIALPTATMPKIAMKGIFFFASDPKCIPTLTIGTNRCSLSETRDNEVAFDVPVAALLTPEQLGSTTRTFSYARGVFNAPWASGWFSWWRTIHPATYNVWLGVLPATPGKLSLTYEANAAGTIQRAWQTQVIFASAEHRGPTLHPTLSLYPNPGWKYAATPVALIVNYIGHVAIQSLIMNSDGTQCTVSLELGGGDWSNVGRIWYIVYWTEYQNVQNKSTRTDEVTDLLWGSSRMFSPLVNETIKKIHLKAFNGADYDFFASSDNSNPFIKLAAQGGQVIIHATTPDDNQVDIVSASRLQAESDVKEKKDESAAQQKVLAHFHTFLEQNRATLTDKKKAFEAVKLRIEEELKEIAAKRISAKSIQEAFEFDREASAQMRTMLSKIALLEDNKVENKRELEANSQMQAIYEEQSKALNIELVEEEKKESARK